MICIKLNTTEDVALKAIEFLERKVTNLQDWMKTQPISHIGMMTISLVGRKNMSQNQVLLLMKHSFMTTQKILSKLLTKTI